jgi:hypothetical protein
MFSILCLFYMFIVFSSMLLDYFYVVYKDNHTNENESYTNENENEKEK